MVPASQEEEYLPVFLVLYKSKLNIWIVDCLTEQNNQNKQSEDINMDSRKL